jgi:hypothetical protein
MPWLFRPRIGPWVFVKRASRTPVGAVLPFSVIGLIVVAFVMLPAIPVAATIIAMVIWLGVFFWSIRKVTKWH